MAIDLYDANNVLRRQTERHGLPSALPMGFRQRYEYLMGQPPMTQIFVWDGRGHNKMRQAILPEYKAQREPMAEDIFAQINLFRRVLEHSHCVQVCVEGWEADDVIATLARRFHEQNRVRCRIHSNDIDYGQLSPIADIVGVNMKDTPGEWLPLRKAVVGKASDNLGGIPGFGPKRFLAMREHWPVLRAAIRNQDVATLRQLPFTKGVAAWLESPENVEWLAKALHVSEFFTVPEDELVGGWKVGTPDRMAAHALMSKFFL